MITMLLLLLLAQTAAAAAAAAAANANAAAAILETKGPAEISAEVVVYGATVTASSHACTRCLLDRATTA
jgi:hypothetical protein